MKDFILLFWFIQTSILGIILFYIAKQMASIAVILLGILRAIQ